jgi:pimeloyl-ACP methyl ester carboxylesterase
MRYQEPTLLDTFPLKPVLMDRDGVRLAHFEAGTASHSSPPLVLVNGWTGDHGIFTPQLAHFSRTHRVVAVNLRGHGASDRPEQEYTMVGFADDVAWQCQQLRLEKPVIIGHSLGGAVALELSGRHPDLPSAMVMIDSIVMTPPASRDDGRLEQFLDGIGGSDYLAVSRASAWDIGCDFDDPERRKAIYEQYILPPCESNPQHVAYSAMKDFLLQHDPAPAAKACTVPMAYISADVPLVTMARDLDRLQELCPQLVIAKTLLAGHFSTIEVADQINAMLERFLAVGLKRCLRFE